MAPAPGPATFLAGLLGPQEIDPSGRCQGGPIAFGRVEKSDALYFALGADRDERARQSAELRRMLATPPAAGTNTVLVSHNGNLKEATGLWPKREGDAFVFWPRPGGTFVCVGIVAAGDWEQWARATESGQRAANCS